MRFPEEKRQAPLLVSIMMEEYNVMRKMVKAFEKWEKILGHPLLLVDFEANGAMQAEFFGLLRKLYSKELE